MQNNKYMQATRKMLYNYSSLLAEMYIKQRELDFICENDGLTGVSYGNTSECQSNSITSKVETIGDRNLQEGKRLLREMKILEMNIDKIKRVLDVLTETEKSIVQMRYIEDDKKDWGYIADSLGYSSKQCQRIGKHAVTKITSLLFGIKSFVDLPLFEYLENAE